MKKKNTPHLKKGNKNTRTQRQKKDNYIVLFVCVCSCVLTWCGLGNWMVQNGMLHCADPMVHSKALDE